MYDSFSVDYDRFVDWDARLGVEMPFIEQQLRAAEAGRVLDTACGTGKHAIALARQGYRVVGTDASEAMIERARANATEIARPPTAGPSGEVRFEVAGFGELAETLGAAGDVGQREESGGAGFDAVLCLGNSLPHVLTAAELAATLHDFADCLRPEGLLLIQNRNFDAVLAQRERWMGPQGHREGGTEWVFVRFYDFDPDGLLTFHMVRLRRDGAADWRQEVNSTRLWPLREDQLVPTLQGAGFGELRLYGDMEGSAFDRTGSPNLVVAARAGA